MSFIVFYQRDRQIFRLPLVGRPIRLGSAPEADFALPNPDLPPLICELEPIGLLDYRFRALTDDGPLSMNGRPVRQGRLQGGETFQMGDIRAVYHRAPLDPSDFKDPPMPVAAAGRQTGTLSMRPDQTLASVDYFIRLKTTSGNQAIPVGTDGIRVGAARENDVVVEDPFVSARHCLIFWKRGLLYVRDLNSTNGIRVNDVPVLEMELKPGFTVQAGQTLLKVEAVSQEVKPETVTGRGPWRFGRLLTQDKSLAQLLKTVEKIAGFDATVCIFGESGTGKELVAEAIHNFSRRSEKRWVTINCAAIPANLIESHLFGHEKGSFTGADKRHIGAFEQADQGTIFLDEIGELPLALQAKLLRVLETGRIRRVGGQEDIALDFRLVVATHRDLPAAVASGDFREDLLHRLYVLPVTLSPLRNRKKDIVLLANHFLSTLSPAGRDFQLSEEARQALLEHRYPGNVRELKNVIQRAVMLSSGDELRRADIIFVPAASSAPTARNGLYQPGWTMEEIERDVYREALGIHKNAAAAAKALGIPKTTFWRRAKQMQLNGQ